MVHRRYCSIISACGPVLLFVVRFLGVCSVVRSALSYDLPRVLGRFVLLLGDVAGVPGVVAAADVLTVSGRGCVVFMRRTSARCLCGSLFCGCAGRGFNCYELTRVVTRLKYPDARLLGDQSCEQMWVM